MYTASSRSIFLPFSDAFPFQGSHPPLDGNGVKSLLSHHLHSSSWLFSLSQTQAQCSFSVYMIPRFSWSCSFELANFMPPPSFLRHCCSKFSSHAPHYSVHFINAKINSIFTLSYLLWVYSETLPISTFPPTCHFNSFKSIKMPPELHWLTILDLRSLSFVSTAMLRIFYVLPLTICPM